MKRNEREQSYEDTTKEKKSRKKKERKKTLMKALMKADNDSTLLANMNFSNLQPWNDTTERAGREMSRVSTGLQSRFKLWT